MIAHRVLACRWCVLATLLMAWLVSACNPMAEKPAVSSTAPSDSASVMVDSVNYMHERGVAYTLFDLSRKPPQAVGGSVVFMLAAGGEKGCCVALPRTWRSGLMFRVTWDESDRVKEYPEKYSRDLEVPPYDVPADLYVVFYPGHEVELVVSAGEPGHPEWRGKLKSTPWQQCVETYGRKPCFVALPKQFDTRSAQGFCTYLTEDKRPDAENLCSSTMERCMQDFEDKPFCKGILWGPRRRQ